MTKINKKTRNNQIHSTLSFTLLRQVSRPQFLPNKSIPWILTYYWTGRLHYLADSPFNCLGAKARKSESMAKWEKNAKRSKIEFLISVFFFFYWINMSIKDNEWPLKCFRGRKISPQCPLNVCMSEHWRKTIFCLKFSKSFLMYLTFVFRKGLYEIC